MFGLRAGRSRFAQVGLPLLCQRRWPLGVFLCVYFLAEAGEVSVKVFGRARANSTVVLPSSPAALFLLLWQASRMTVGSKGPSSWTGQFFAGASFAASCVCFSVYGSGHMARRYRPKLLSKRSSIASSSSPSPVSSGAFVSRSRRSNFQRFVDLSRMRSLQSCGLLCSTLATSR